jgi:hypothetical protein
VAFLAGYDRFEWLKLKCFFDTHNWIELSMPVTPLQYTRTISLKERALIMLLMFAGPSSVKKLRIENFPKGQHFHPHGIALWITGYDMIFNADIEPEEGKRLLFVVDHRAYRDAEYVDVFEYRDGIL